MVTKKLDKKSQATEIMENYEKWAIICAKYPEDEIEIGCVNNAMSLGEMLGAMCVMIEGAMPKELLNKEFINQISIDLKQVLLKMINDDKKESKK